MILGVCQLNFCLFDLKYVKIGLFGGVIYEINAKKLQ
jgi:hypothetical protein